MCWPAAGMLDAWWHGMICMICMECSLVPDLHPQLIWSGQDRGSGSGLRARRTLQAAQALPSAEVPESPSAAPLFVLDKHRAAQRTSFRGRAACSPPLLLSARANRIGLDLPALTFSGFCTVTQRELSLIELPHERGLHESWSWSISTTATLEASDATINLFHFCGPACLQCLCL